MSAGREGERLCSRFECEGEGRFEVSRTIEHRTKWLVGTWDLKRGAKLLTNPMKLVIFMILVQWIIVY